MTMTMQEQTEQTMDALMFEVHEEPVITESGIETGHKAIVRSDNRTCLAVNTDDYVTIPLSETLVPDVKRLIGEGWQLAPASGRHGVRRPPIRVEGMGRRAYVELYQPSLRVQVAVGDIVNPRLVVAGSYDRSCAHSLRAGAFRVICTNGAVVSHGPQFSARIKHVGDADMKARELVTLAAQFMENFEAITEQWREMEQVRPARRIIEAAIVESLGSRRGEQLMGRMEKEPTAWKVYNEITQALTYGFKGAEDAREHKDKLAFGILTGRIQPIDVLAE